MSKPNHALHFDDIGRAHPAAYLDGATARDWFTGVALEEYQGYAIDGSLQDGTLFDIGTDRSTGERTWTAVSIGVPTPT
jgi:hypothetical protein